MAKRYNDVIFDVDNVYEILAEEGLEDDESEFQFIYGIYWDDFIENLACMIKRKFKEHLSFKLNGKNLNWRGSSGTAYVKGSDMDKLIKNLFYKLRSWSTDYVKVESHKNGLLITMYSHDCPTGATFHMIKCAESTVDYMNM